jgi:hypothetical protein
MDGADIPHTPVLWILPPAPSVGLDAAVGLHDKGCGCVSAAVSLQHSVWVVRCVGPAVYWQCCGRCAGARPLQHDGLATLPLHEPGQRAAVRAWCVCVCLGCSKAAQSHPTEQLLVAAVWQHDKGDRIPPTTCDPPYRSKQGAPHGPQPRSEVNCAELGIIFPIMMLCALNSGRCSLGLH